MFVRCFSLHGLTSRSSAREFSPTIIPSYTSSPGADEQRAALLEVHQREWAATPRAVGDERTARPRAQLAGHGSQRSNTWCSDPGAAGLGEELGAQADQAARRDEVLHPHPAGAVVDHVLDAALAQREQLRDDADVLLRHVDRADARPARGGCPSISRVTHLRLADGQLEALAAHQLDEDRQRAARRGPAPPRRPGARCRRDAQRDVADQLLVEAGLELARGQLVAAPGRRAARC